MFHLVMWKRFATRIPYLKIIQVLIGPRHVKMCLQAYADSEGQDRPAHPSSL